MLASTLAKPFNANFGQWERHTQADHIGDSPLGNLTEAAKNALSRYATFSGRAARPEFWWWILALFIVLIVTSIIDAYVISRLLGFEVGDENAGKPLSLLVSLLVLLPNLAIGVRRLHDSDRTGWWILIGVVPIVGTILLIYFFVQPGTDGANRFGETPKWAPRA